MVSTEQFKRGTINYIERELLPLMQGWKKIAAATYVSLAADNVEKMLLGIKDHPMVAVLGVFDENGMIDEDKLCEALHKQIDSDICIPIPVLGEFNFNRADVDKLTQHIKRG